MAQKSIAVLGQLIPIFPCYADTALLLSYAVCAISLCYYWPAAGGSGQGNSIDVDADPLEQPTSTRAVKLQLSFFYKSTLINFR